MKPRHQVSREAMELIKSFEGFRRSAAKLADGRWTIGYGHTKTAREGVEISEKDAEALLIYDLLEITAAVNAWTYTPLTQNQFDALVSFAFNVGLSNFRGSSVLLRINEGAMLQAAGALEMWRKADFEGERIVVDALVRRRAAEKTLFLTPPGGWAPAPSPVVKPLLDPDLTSAQRPTSLIVPMDGPAAVAHQEITAQAIYEDQPSATEAAAGAVAARLQALMPEPPEAAEEAPAIVSMPAPLESPAPEGELPVETPVDFTEAVVEPDLQASSAVDGEELAVPTPEGAEDTPMFGPAPAIVSGETAAAPSPDAAEEVPAAPYAPSVASADVARPAIYDDTPMFSDAFTVFDEPAARPGSLALAPYVILGVVGIVLAGGGVFWGATTQSPYAWAASLVGIVFIAASVYYLLERLGGGSD